VVGLTVVDSDENLFEKRTNLYETLLEYFPDAMKQPKSSLLDFVL
jgi:hypothetical protein